MIPLSKPYIDESDAQAVYNCVMSGWILQGPNVKEFEKLLKAYIGMPYALAVSNCTTGLHLALHVAGITYGDEVIVPSYSYIATTNCVVHAGAIPVFADIHPQTFNIDPEEIEKHITPKTKAIIAVDQMGLCADWDAIRAIAEKYNLFLLEDAACGLGATYKGKNAGTFGDIAAFSFHPRKAITTAEGGLITTRKKTYADLITLMRAHGANISVAKRNASKKVVLEEFPVIGYNYRMSDIHAALGISQFRKLPEIMEKRQKIANVYNIAFKDHSIVKIPFVPKGFYHTYQTYQVRLEGMEKKRTALMQYMLDHGITIRQGIPSAHLQPPYRSMYPNISLPATEKASKETICLPVYTAMTDTEMQTVIQTLLSGIRKLA